MPASTADASEAELAAAAAAEAAAQLMLKGHPYRFLHGALPVLLAASHPSVRRFAWTLVEAIVVRVEKYPLPSPRHLDSFLRIWRRYRAEAEALGDSEVVGLLDRAIAASRYYDPATMSPPSSLSVIYVVATLEASELAYVRSLVPRMREPGFLDEVRTFVEATPAPAARDAATTLIGIYARTRGRQEVARA